MEEVLPLPTKFQALLPRCHMETNNSSGFFGLMSASIAPVLSSTNKDCCQVMPPSVVLYTPLSGLGEYKCPIAATQAIFLFCGSKIIFPMCSLSGSPRYCHFLPVSTLL